MDNYFKNIYDVLVEVYKNDGYTQIVLNSVLDSAKPEDKPVVTKTVYGVLDKNVYLEYILERFVDKKPRPNVNIILKIGAYMLRFLKVKNYAIVDNLVTLTKEIGKKQLCGFVNATLKKIADSGEDMFSLPSGRIERLSVLTGYQKWVIQKLEAQYGEELTKAILTKRETVDFLEHVRVNNLKVNEQNFEKKLRERKIKYFKSSVRNGFFVEHIDTKKHADIAKMFVNQSISSMIICEIAASLEQGSVLDVCAAPGGKSVYIASLKQGAEVVACDIHEHRVELIKKYMQKMGVKNVFPSVCDATAFKKEFESRFSVVLADVLCSGFGVADMRPDIKIRRTSEDIRKICKIQSGILSNTAKYVAKGGYLVYSTCTLFHEENQDIVNAFLKDNSEFKTVKPAFNFDEKAVIRYGDYVQMLPNISEYDGFFVAVLKRG